MNNNGKITLHKLIDSRSDYDSKKVLYIIEFYIECGLQTLLVSPNIEEGCLFSNDVFRSIIAINIMINKRNYCLGIMDLVGSGYLAERCINLLGDYYGIDIQFVP